MTSSHSSTPPIVVLDTCVISGIVRGDLKSEDAAALSVMASMVAKSTLTMWTSPVAREEIDRIPAEYRDAHLERYDTLRQIRASAATWLNLDPAWSDLKPVVHHPDYVRLRGILRDEADARMVFQAKAAGVTDFVTVDYKSVLNKASDLSTLGIRALSPTQYVSRLSTE